MTKVVLRTHAVVDLVLGLLLTAATWNSLYETLRLPHPDPALYAQVLGVTLLAFAYLLWIAPRSSDVTQVVALSGAAGNALIAAVLVLWLVWGDLGHSMMWLIAGGCLVFAVAEALIAARSVAILLPGD